MLFYKFKILNHRKFKILKPLNEFRYYFRNLTHNKMMSKEYIHFNSLKKFNIEGFQHN